jgi:hypothetical protein
MFIRPALERVARAILKKRPNTKDALIEGPVSYELLEKIASEYQYHFDVIRPDGTVLRFRKIGTTPKDEPHFDAEVW